MIREIEKQRMFCFLLLRFGPESQVHENMETVDNDAFTEPLFKRANAFSIASWTQIPYRCSFSEPKSHSEPLFKSLNLVKLKNVIELQILSFVYQ